MDGRIYVAIDLKSFYASVECVERGLDPLTTNLVVADGERTDKTICLAVTPSMKAQGIAGRPRLFEVIQKVKQINSIRQRKIGYKEFIGSSFDAKELTADAMLEFAYITAVPRMAYYMEYSTKVYQVYLKYISPQDIHVYSIDEVMIDITPYLKRYRTSAHELTKTILLDVLSSTGITATAGIGTNLYLAKVAMDITAKHILPDEDGVRIAELDEISYRKELWAHQPITDFWRVGRGYANKLEAHQMLTMGDVARCSLGKEGDYHNEDLLYKLFGVNAELLIDHAWGYEPCRMSDIKAYKPRTNSLGAGQVLTAAYTAEQARIITFEMADALVLDLVDKGLCTNQIVLHIGYDRESLAKEEIRKQYRGEIKTDHYGRAVPKSAHGTVSLKQHTSSTKQIVEATVALYDQIVNPILLVRRVNVTMGNVIPVGKVAAKEEFRQIDLFTDYEAEQLARQRQQEFEAKEKKIQQALLDIKKKYGSNAILKGINLEEGATAKQRNRQIGGHRA